MVVRFRLADWLVYLLAGYPHLLFSLRVALSALAASFVAGTAYWVRLDLIYGLLLGFGLLLGLVRGLPRWSGSWVGYGLLFGLELLGRGFPHGISAWIARLLWLAAALLALALLARRDRLSALLAGLPLAPMFAWSLALNRLPDLPLLAAAGFALGLLSVLVAHLEREKLAVLLVFLVCGGFSLLFSFAASAGQILPLRLASLGGLLSWAGLELGFLGSMALFSTPAWLSWLVEQARRLD